MVADVKLPLRQATAGADDKDSDGRPFLSGVRRLPVPAPVCRARHMPRDARHVAVATLGAGAAVLYTGVQQTLPTKDEQEAPTQTVQATEQTAIRLGGYEGKQATCGLSWAPQQDGVLLAGGLDGALCVWDVSASTATSPPQPSPSGPAAVAPLMVEHGEPVSDACFHPRTPGLMGVVRGGVLELRDQRAAKEAMVLRAPAEERLCSVSFSSAQEQHVATGSDRGHVHIWDTRMAGAPAHRFAGHRGAVLQVEWSPGMGGVVASTAEDRRVLVWDTTRVGRPQSPDERAEGPPELLFVHGGHTALVTDMAWNPHDPLTMASVAADNILQIWQPASVL